MEVRRLWVKRKKSDFQAWADLLDRANIRKEKSIDQVLGVFEKDTLIATGAVHGNVIKCVAVCKAHTGGSAVSLLVSRLEEMIYDTYDSCYLYTKPDAAASFQHLGFKEIIRIKHHLVFMEKSLTGFAEYLQRIEQCRLPGEKQAGLVINANPFTLGHQYLVERASEENDAVYIFVVSEDRSYVPFQDRWRLVKEGTQHLENVVVMETGPYLVSQATFPSYFLPENVDATKVQAELDATLFKEKIAPVMHITHRYVGEEPLSKTTEIYNEQMKKVFGEDIQLTVLKRKEWKGDVISATKVRALWEQGSLEAIRPLVPASTFAYIEDHLEGV